MLKLSLISLITVSLAAKVIKPNVVSSSCKESIQTLSLFVPISDFNKVRLHTCYVIKNFKEKVEGQKKTLQNEIMVNYVNECCKDVVIKSSVSKKNYNQSFNIVKNKLKQLKPVKALEIPKIMKPVISKYEDIVKYMTKTEALNIFNRVVRNRKDWVKQKVKPHFTKLYEIIKVMDTTAAYKYLMTVRIPMVKPEKVMSKDDFYKLMAKIIAIRKDWTKDIVSPHFGKIYEKVKLMNLEAALEFLTTMKLPAQNFMSKEVYNELIKKVIEKREDWTTDILASHIDYIYSKIKFMKPDAAYKAVMEMKLPAQNFMSKEVYNELINKVIEKREDWTTDILAPHFGKIYEKVKWITPETAFKFLMVLKLQDQYLMPKEDFNKLMTKVITYRKDWTKEIISPHFNEIYEKVKGINPEAAYIILITVKLQDQTLMTKEVFYEVIKKVIEKREDWTKEIISPHFAKIYEKIKFMKPEAAYKVLLTIPLTKPMSKVEFTKIVVEMTKEKDLKINVTKLVEDFYKKLEMMEKDDIIEILEKYYSKYLTKEVENSS